MRILVTGGAGFIGSHLVEYHLAKHDEVHVIDDLSTGLMENIRPFKKNPNFHFIKADMLVTPKLQAEVCWADRIYHMAAVVGVFKVINDSERLLAINIAATERLLRAARTSSRKPRILLASTSEVYGEGHAGPSSEMENLIIGEGKKSCSIYSVSKIAMEYFGLSYYQHTSLPITILRIFNTIGPRQIKDYGMVVPRFITSALQEATILVHGSGEQTRSFCDVRDIVAIMDKLAECPESIGQVVNIGQDQEISINDLAHLIKKLAHSRSDIKHLSFQEVYGDDFEDTIRRRPLLTKLQKLIQYDYQWDLQKTLTDLIARKKADLCN